MDADHLILTVGVPVWAIIGGIFLAVVLSVLVTRWIAGRYATRSARLKLADLHQTIIAILRYFDAIHLTAKEVVRAFDKPIAIADVEGALQALAAAGWVDRNNYAYPAIHTLAPRGLAYARQHEYKVMHAEKRQEVQFAKTGRY